MSAEWRRILAHPDRLGGLYGSSPPAPGACDLFYVHLDERENSVTLGFDTRTLPASPPDDWIDKGFNAFEFHLVFTEVASLRISGWGADEARVIGLVAGDGEFYDVALGPTGSGITFRAPASTVRLVRARAYSASDAL